MKSQLYKSPEVIDAKDSLLQRCRFYPALAMTALLSVLTFASSPRAAAQFLTAPCASESITFACFQVVVNPNFAWLMDPGSGPATSPYPGWSNPNLTSPGLIDDKSAPAGSPIGQTVIGESKGLVRPPLTGDFPIVIGAIGCGASGGGSGGLYGYSMPNGFSYYYPFLGWQYPLGAGTPTATTLTEIQYFTLTSSGGGSAGQGCPPGTSSLYPPQTSGQDILVKSGYQNFGDPARRSIGMIVSELNSSGTTPAANDFNANSFFDVYVEVTLPTVAGTVSGSGASGGSAVFPSGGALLINDSAHPLIVTNILSGFPSGVGSNNLFYVHSSATPAVPLVFEYDNPNPNYPGDGSGKPYWWHKGDSFGWIQLAGHGIFNPCAKSTLNWDFFMGLVLGEVAHAQPAAPVGGLFSTPGYPFTTCSYRMAQGTNFGGQPWDAITFSNTTSISGAFLTLSNFQMSVALPAFGSSVTYTNTNTVANISWSLDSLTSYVPTQSTGTVVVQITNTNTPVNGVTTYNTTLLQCSFAGFANFGQWALQLDTTKPNTGLHTVQALRPGGYRITGFFDARFQVSANGGASWTESDAQNRLYLGDSPCGASIEPIHGTLSGKNLIIDWANPSYTLEGSDSLNPAVWVPIPGGSPVTLPANTPYRFFQLNCD